MTPIEIALAKVATLVSDTGLNSVMNINKKQKAANNKNNSVDEKLKEEEEKKIKKIKIENASRRKKINQSSFNIAKDLDDFLAKHTKKQYGLMVADGKNKKRNKKRKKRST